MSVIDSYSEANSNTEFIIGSSFGQTGSGQSFTADGKQLLSAQLYLRKQGTPTGDVNAKIYAHSGTFGSSSIPTGSALATSDAVDASTLTGSLALVTFNFSGGEQILLTNGSNYVVTVEGAFSGFSNYVLAGRDDTSPTHAGCASRRDAGGTWATEGSAVDMIFYVNGDIPPELRFSGNNMAAILAQ